VGTSNPASLYRLESAPAESGVFLSRPVDAGATARWGSLTWRTSGDVGRLEYQTRSGESGEPDGTWSDWSSALTIPGGSKIESPPGRFLQWRVRMFAGGDDEGRAVPATAWFTTENRTPRVRDFRLDGTPPWVAGSAVFRWAAQDADGDPVAAAIEIRRPDAERWEVVARNALGDVKPSDLVGEPETGWKESRSTWDTTAHGEGAWDVRVVVDDRASNPPGQGKQESSEPPLRVTVDRTGPVIETNSTGGIFEIVVRDEASPVVRLEVLGEDGVIAAPDCADGVCDSSKETFRVSADLANPGPGRSLRAFDAAGNAAEAPFP
jgi:hypothetical protein